MYLYWMADLTNFSATELKEYLDILGCIPSAVITKLWVSVSKLTKIAQMNPSTPVPVSLSLPNSCPVVLQIIISEVSFQYLLSLNF